jgi:hypothetical protein
MLYVNRTRPCRAIPPRIVDESTLAVQGRPSAVVAISTSVVTCTRAAFVAETL